MLKHEVVGSGDPLVLVHGIGHRRQGWYPVLDRLSEQRTVVLFDLPGHGQSHDLVTNGRPITEVLHDELIGLLDQLGLDHPHIAGNSLGGRIALEAAADDLVASATALSPAGFWRGSADFAYTRALFASVVTAGRAAGPLVPTLARSTAGRAALVGWIHSHPSRVDSSLVIGDARNMVRSRPALRTIIRQATVFDRPIPEHIPVTVAWAEHDHVLPRYQAKRAAAQLPDAQHLMLSGVGHVPMPDDPSMVAEVLLQGSSQGMREEDVA
ncbi:MAG: alpha/beta fold hydrolase [Nocardioidaceae bacterium]|nr:alpha/beta fold hydrolase [Nocardioidaceae bacterium]MCL2614690.1 alpha/beta fold hydrolase [Nocardioidaceae bacterium]